MSDKSEQMKSPPCRICGNSRWVAMFDTKHPEKAICMDCCGFAEHENGESGHEYERTGFHVPSCIHCGAER